MIYNLKNIIIVQDAVKVMAKSLVRNRHAVTKMYALKSQLQAVSLRIQVCLLFSQCIYYVAACHSSPLGI